MQFKSVIGQQQIKKKLISSFFEGRIANTQLFLGDDGAGPLPLAIAFAQFLLCENKAENDSCNACPSCKKFSKLAHPDVHFYFPTTTNQTVKKDPKSSLFLDKWRDYLTINQGYIEYNSWLDFLGVGNKQGYIRADDANEIITKASLKAFEGKFKIFIIYMVDKMNEPASNKLLKTFEEPSKNTVILLTSNSYEQLLPTVRSRTQLIKVNKLSTDEIYSALLDKGVETPVAREAASLGNGSWILSNDIAEHQDDEKFNFINLRNWLRLCFQPKDYNDLLKFNQEISKLGREKLKSFLSYGLEIVHNSILNNSGNPKKILKTGEELDFTVKFAPFINEANQNNMYKLFNEAIYHVERNAHAGIMITDMSFKIINLLRSGKKYKTKN